MQLAAPSIGGELSACGRQVWLENLRTGATASLIVDGAPPVVLGKADWPAQFFDLPAGLVLKSGSQVQALQRLGPDASAPSNDRAVVQAVPSPLPQPVVTAPVMGCAARLFVGSLVGGSIVTVRDSGGSVLGSHPAQGWFAAVPLSRPLNLNEQVEVDTAACGSSSIVHSPGATQLKPGSQLDPPGAPAAIYECQRIIEFSALLPGTTLVLARRGTTIEYSVEATTLDARIDPPLSAGETLEVSIRGERRCELRQSPNVTLTAVTGPPAAPRLASAVCPGSRKVTVFGLIASAEVQLMRDTETLLDTEVAASTIDLDLAGISLAAGQRLSVRQRVCQNGEWSAATHVPSHVTAPKASINLRVQEPVAECGLVVRVIGVVPGSFVTLMSALMGGGRIGHAVAVASAVDVIVTPPLLHGDTITVDVDGCATASLATPVRAVPKSAPHVSRAVAGDTAVDVDHVRPGAIVDVTVDGVWAGAAITPVDTARVAVRHPLVGRESVGATCRYCDVITKDDPVLVTPRTPARFSRATSFGMRALHDDRWKAGRVHAISPLPGGGALVGTESAGLWVIRPGVNAEPLSEGWTDGSDFGDPGNQDPVGGIRCLAQDPGSGRRFAGTGGALWYTDTSAADPLRSWIRLPGILDDTRALLVLPSRNMIIAATSAGVRRAPLNPWPPAAAEGTTDPGSGAFPFWSLAEGPSDSVVAYGGYQPVGQQVGTIFVGDWTASGLSWSLVALDNPNDPDAALLRRIAADAGLGALASAPSDRNHVYLTLQDKPADRWFPILRSSDGGKTWGVPSHGPLEQLREGGVTNMGHQAWRCLTISVHPTQPDTILIGGCRDGLLASYDGGKSWDTGNYPGLGNANGDPFHPDVLTMFFDETDPAGNTVWVGSDGGLFRSADMGKSWDESANTTLPTLMFDPADHAAPSLSASPANPGLLVGATQDNGFVYCRGVDQRWEQVEGGDGWRAKFVTGDVALLDNFSDGELHWFIWDGTDLVDKGTLEPPGTQPNLFPNRIVRVPHPAYADGGLMVAVASSDNRTELFGLFDTKPGLTDGDRLKWTQIAELTAAPTGLGTWDGTTVIASSADGASNGRYHSIDTTSGDITDCATTVPTARGAARWITFIGPVSAAAVDNAGLVRSDDLQTWRAVANAPLPSGTANLLAFAVDPFPSPAVVYAGDTQALYASGDWGTNWTPVAGLPGLCVLSQVEYLSADNGTRQLSLATWNWSAWLATLQ